MTSAGVVFINSSIVELFYFTPWQNFLKLLFLRVEDPDTIKPKYVKK